MTNITARLAAQAIGYRRVSTVEQSDSGLGLEAQETAIASAAARLGLPLGDTFTDGALSGGLPLESRPALLAALAALRRGDTLIVAKRDRLGRDVLNVALIARLVERRGARIVSAAGEGSGDGPSERLMRQIIDCFAEYERHLISFRTTAALAALRARGQRCGTVPYGSQVAADGKMLEPHTGEQRTLVLLRSLRAKGMTLRAVADELNRRGHRTRAKSEWLYQYVSRQIEREPSRAA